VCFRYYVIMFQYTGQSGLMMYVYAFLLFLYFVSYCVM